MGFYLPAGGKSHGAHYNFPLSRALELTIPVVRGMEVAQAGSEIAPVL